MSQAVPEGADLPDLLPVAEGEREELLGARGSAGPRLPGGRQQGADVPQQHEDQEGSKRVRSHSRFFQEEIDCSNVGRTASEVKRGFASRVKLERHSASAKWAWFRKGV